MKKEETELRYNILSNEWVIISPGRKARPNNFRKSGDCPFCEIKDQKEPKYYFYKGKENKEKFPSKILRICISRSSFLTKERSDRTQVNSRFFFLP